MTLSLGHILGDFYENTLHSGLRLGRPRAEVKGGNRAPPRKMQAALARHAGTCGQNDMTSGICFQTVQQTRKNVWK